jgi:hypothetical protein
MHLAKFAIFLNLMAGFISNKLNVSWRTHQEMIILKKYGVNLHSLPFKETFSFNNQNKPMIIIKKN